MALVANLGALQFAFRGACHACLPPLNVRPFLLTEGVTVGLAGFETGEFLVLDHRSVPDSPARVEYWAATGPAEGRRTNLLVIADARAGQQAPDAEAFRGLLHLVESSQPSG
jgi:hypothetical protein